MLVGGHWGLDNNEARCISPSLYFVLSLPLFFCASQLLYVYLVFDTCTYNAGRTTCARATISARVPSVQAWALPSFQNVALCSSTSKQDSINIGSNQHKQPAALVAFFELTGVGLVSQTNKLAPAVFPSKPRARCEQDNQ